MNIAPMEFQYAGNLINPSEAATVNEYDIATGTVIKAGQLVTLTAGKIVAITVFSAAWLGMAMEPHDGASDDRQKGLKILISDSPFAIYKCRPHCTIVADSGNATTVVDDAFVNVADDVFNNAKLKLVAYGANHTLTVGLGKIIPVTDFTALTGTFTAAMTGGAVAGDTLVVLPPINSTAFPLNSTGTNLDLKEDTGSAFRIVKVDTELETVSIVPAKHVFCPTLS